MTDLDLQELTDQIEETIRDLTGIALDSASGTWEQSGTVLRLTGPTGVVLEYDLEPYDDPEDLLAELDARSDLLSHLTAQRLALVEQAERKRIEALLRERLPGLECEVEFSSGSHWPSHHGMVEEEYVRDYPPLTLQLSVCDTEAEPVEVTINPYAPREWIDPHELDAAIERLRAEATRNGK